jgi:hypothetical protein
MKLFTHPWYVKNPAMSTGFILSASIT